MKLFLTGGTGFIGSFLAVELLKKGFFVIILARDKGHISAKKRVDSVLKFVCPIKYESFASSYCVVKGNITKKDLGLSQDDMGYIRELGTHVVLHAAGSVDFSKKNERSTALVNLEGTKNILEFAKTLNVKQFNHLSTLYVAGNRTGTIFEHELNQGQSFNNVYEETKAKAEELIYRWSDHTGIPYNIYRLPITIGDSSNGKTLSFTGFYGFFKPFWNLAKNIQKRINNHFRLAEAGICMDNGLVSAPLFVKCTKESWIDMVPIDWVTRNIRLLIEKMMDRTRNLTFHIDNPSDSSSYEIIERALPLVGIKGIKFVSSNERNLKLRHPHKVLNGYQRVVDAITDQYFAYVTNKKKFDNSNLIDILGIDYKPPPKVNEIVLKTMLGYAIQKEFKPPIFI